MKKQTQVLVGVLALITLFTVAVAKGQSASQRFTAKIPFEFNVGDQALPAGEYEISVVNPSSDQRVLRIRNTKSTDSAMVQTTSVTAKTASAAKLVFRVLGDRRFLMQAWTGVDQNGLAASRSKTEEKYRNNSTLARQRTEAIALNRVR